MDNEKIAGELVKIAKGLVSTEQTASRQVSAETLRGLEKELKVWRRALQNAKSREQTLELMDEVGRIKKKIDEKLKKSSMQLTAARVVEVAHGLSEDDILYSSWGYDQTNVDFYQVVKVLAKSVVIREIDKKVHHSGQTEDYMVPVPGRFKGSPMRKKVTSSGGVKIKSYSWASPWDGKPKYQTGWGFGH